MITNGWGVLVLALVFTLGSGVNLWWNDRKWRKDHPCCKGR